MEAWEEKKRYKEDWCWKHIGAIPGDRDYEHIKQLHEDWICCNNRLADILKELRKTANKEDAEAIDRGLHLIVCDTAILKAWMPEDPVKGPYPLASRLFDTRMKRKRGKQANDL